MAKMGFGKLAGWLAGSRDAAQLCQSPVALRFMMHSTRILGQNPKP